MDNLLELLQFIKQNERLDLKSAATSSILSLTGSLDGRKLVCSSPDFLKQLFLLIDDQGETTDTGKGARYIQEQIGKDSLLAIVNISADADGAVVLLKEIPNIVRKSIESILDETNKLADAWTMVLSNISRPENLVEQVIDELVKFQELDYLEKLVGAFTRIEYNKEKCKLNYLGPIFSNLSQSKRGRDWFCSSETKLLERLLPFVQHEESVVRRGGAIGLLKNLCFDSSSHSWLLSDNVDVLPYILLPLAGPDELSAEENDMLPLELQYLDADKKREADPDLRKMLLESLAQLCATKWARDYLRAKGTYEILRELHKWEIMDVGDNNVLLALENVVDILIRTEDEIGQDNLKEIEIPNDLQTKFENMDKNLTDT